VRSVLTVTHPAAVRLLTRGRARWVLGAFLRGENSVAGAARELNLDLRLVHRDVGALLSAGLLQVVREQKRAGRAVKVYTATAPAFFVPFSATDAADFAELGGKREQLYDELLGRASLRKFEQLHHEQSGGREWGVRLYLGPEGQVQVDTSYEGAELVEAAVRYQGPVGLLLSARTALRLTEAEAEEVQIELIRLLMRLRPISVQHEQNGTGQPFLLRLGLVGVSEEEAQSLQ
jgi:hypothetical protein